jgi:hypothetical protein
MISVWLTAEKYSRLDFDTCSRANVSVTQVGDRI